jgi:hypothetical protein
MSTEEKVAAPEPEEAPFPTEKEEEQEMEQAQESKCMIYYRKASYWWATGLLIFALCVVLYGIGKRWNNPPWNVDDSHAAVDIIVFLFNLYWIALLEGCQISIVGLQVIDMEQYKDSHPLAYRSCKLCHRGANVERFLVGRQFLLLFNGFLASRTGSGKASAYGDDFYMGDWDWNEEATQFFYGNSALLLIIIVAGFQLPSQLVAARKMLGFFELPIAQFYFVVIPCMVVESIGLTHASYPLKDLLAWVARIDRSEEDPEKKMNKNAWHWIRVFISIAAVIFSGTFIIKGLAMDQTGATDGPGWRKLPSWAAIILALFFIFIMACAEGLQVAALALAKTPLSELKIKAPGAYRNMELLVGGRNMQAFLVGRQFILALQMVLLAKVTSYRGDNGHIDGDDWGMPRWFNEWLLQTGFLGAILVVNVGQLMSQVTASIFPIGFIDNYLMTILLYIMMAIEASGIVNACWPLSWAIEYVGNMEADPFDDDENVKSIEQNILDRKKSMGLAVPKTEGGASGTTAVSDGDKEYQVEYSYKVSYI